MKRTNRITEQKPTRFIPLAILLLVTAVIGCGESDLAVEPLAVGITEVRSADRTVGEQDSEDLPLKESGPSGQQDQDLLLDDLKIPELADEENFFLPPKPETVKTQTAAATEAKQETVRLIGFVRSEFEEEHQAMALLKIDERLVPIRSGESFENVDLISVDLTKRVAIVQFHRRRLTLTMMDQPIVNQVGPERASPLFARQTRGQGSKPRSAEPPVGVKELPDELAPPETPEIDLPQVPAQSDVQLPDDFELPDLPELPSLDDFSSAF